MNFLKKIFSPVCLIVSISILIYVIYVSSLEYLFDKSDYYSSYYLISFILIILSILTFFINQTLKEYTIIIVISSLLSIYLFEGYLIYKEQLLKKDSLKEKLKREQLYKDQTGIDYDTRTKLEIYDDLKKINDQVVLFVGPTPLHKYKDESLYSLSGISKSETIYCKENGYYSFYQSDRYGFNNPDEEWDKKEIEYLLVGDSHTHGACVNRPHDITSVLRTLSNKSALNLGMGGNGPILHYATLREYLNSNVKKVLWIYFENDLEDLIKEMTPDYKLINNYINDPNFTQNLKFKQHLIDDLAIKLLGAVREKKIRSLTIDKKTETRKIIKYIKMDNVRHLLFPEPKKAIPVTEFEKILTLAKDLVNKNNSELFFAYLPTYYRYKYTDGANKNWNTNYDSVQNYNLVKDIVNKLEIPFIDIHKEVFEKEPNPLKLYSFEIENHYTIEGYKKVAETIYKHTKN